MFVSRRRSVLFTSAAALFALSLSLPASAETTAAEDMAAVAASPDAAANAAEIPTPRARPAPVRKRTATVVRTVSPRPEPLRVAPHYQRLAAHWPILFIGVGW